MRPPSAVEVKCHICPETFRNIRLLKNHLAAKPHQRLSLICVWCREEAKFRKMVDLKNHAKTHHRSKLELMPTDFFSENNGFWMAIYPEDYRRVIAPSGENTQQAIKARMEVLSFLEKVKNTARTRQEWVQGWRSPTTAPPPTKSANKSWEAEDLRMTMGGSEATLSAGKKYLKVELKDSIFRDPKAVEALARRMASLQGRRWAVGETQSRVFHTVGHEDKDSWKDTAAQALGIQISHLGEINLSGELFDLIRPMTPLPTPSTSEITLDLEEDITLDFEEEMMEIRKRKTEEEGQEEIIEKKRVKTGDDNEEGGLEEEKKRRDEERSEKEREEQIVKEGIEKERLKKEREEEMVKEKVEKKRLEKERLGKENEREKQILREREEKIVKERVEMEGRQNEEKEKEREEQILREKEEREVKEKLEIANVA
ncbi:coiled-coil domain-containing protein 112-like [Patella vulgata]|uniref:coiled-coil domain-containing protein 112-like n=1 Tax=Patella vulgata TaxID=6465 RepID=UPI0024A8FC19|nr:coiled-coil domain-containing protein 112-like [Patella vulgata]